MAVKTIEGRVREIIAEQLGLSSDEVGLDAEFMGDLGADDLDFIELVMAFEEEFDLDIDDDESCRFASVKDVVSYITDRVH